MREIHHGLLWTGNARDIREPRKMFAAGIAAVVDLAYEEPPALLPRQVVYCRFPIVDGAGNAPELLRIAMQTTVELLKSGTPMIVSCSAGLSRSPTIATCALAIHLDCSPEIVLGEVNRQTSLELHGALWNECVALIADGREPTDGP